MLSIGLTGGIGSGKSEVTRMFEQLGVPVIDADVIAHQLVQAGTAALAEVVDVFGESILNDAGELDRARLADIVFNDAGMKKQLEAIIHPRVREQIQQFKNRHREQPYIMVVIPLLIESGLAELVDRVLVVNANESVRIQRVHARDGRSSEQIIAIMQHQADDAQRQAAAHDSIDNSGSLDELQQAVISLHQQYIELASHDNFM